MGINFHDLQVLLQRVTEMGRIPHPGHQIDAQQQAVAMAAQVQSERDRRRVQRSQDAARGNGTQRARTGERRERAQESAPGSDKLGRHLDVRG